MRSRFPAWAIEDLNAPRAWRDNSTFDEIQRGDKEMQTFFDLVANWLPLIVALVVFAFVARAGGVRARAPSGRSMIEIYELHLEELKRNNATLERIAQALESHIARQPGASS